jgi:hypothetical protein
MKGNMSWSTQEDNEEPRDILLQSNTKTSTQEGKEKHQDIQKETKHGKWRQREGNK